VNFRDKPIGLIMGKNRLLEVIAGKDMSEKDYEPIIMM
jgi:hypothetical protein